MAGVRINHVVYRDAPAARNDMVTGRIQLQFSNVPGSVTHFRAGTARVLAHTGREAVPVLPGVEASPGRCRASRPMNGTASSCRPARRRRSAAGSTPR